MNHPQDMDKIEKSYQKYIKIYIDENKQCKLKKILDSNRDLPKISEYITDWETKLQVPLGIPANKVKNIKEARFPQPVLERIELLKVWKGIAGVDATYENLIKACIKGEHADAVENICKYMQESIKDMEKIEKSYQQYIKLYIDENKQWKLKEIPDSDLPKISEYITDWETKLQVPLGIPANKVKNIKEAHFPQPVLERTEVLTVWKGIAGVDATYENLIKACIEGEHADAVENICIYIQETTTAKALCDADSGSLSPTDQPPKEPAAARCDADSSSLSPTDQPPKEPAADHTYNGISKPLALALAQESFSASYAWNLKSLKAQGSGLDGTGTTIAIFDTAVDFQSPAFSQKTSLYFNLLPYTPISSMEHGNVCASVAAGHEYQYSSEITVPSGVAPNANLFVYRVAEGNKHFIDAVLAALDDVKIKIESGTKIDIVSISSELDGYKEEEMEKKIKTLTEKGVVVVAAAGNRGNYQAHASIPARFNNVISVGALDRYGSKSKFNCCGRIDVFAPGENITSSLSGAIFWGTSFAAPAISGLVSLLKQLANNVGEPASSHIHKVELLRSIFQKHMMTKSVTGKNVFDPAGFLERVMKNPGYLNEIVCTTQMEE